MTRPLVAAAAALLPALALAHASSTGLATLELREGASAYRLTLVLGELPEAPRGLLGRAVDGDTAAAERVAELARAAVGIEVAGEPCRPGRFAIRGSGVGDGRVDLELALRCPAPAGELVLRDGWPATLGEHHRTLARLELPGGTQEAAFSASSGTVRLPLGGGGPPAHGFFGLGVEHILGGWDHLLFLLVLMLRGGTLGALLRVVTAFSLAHSVTLALAVLGVATPSARLVEPAIAASIVWVALENLRGEGTPSHRWLLSLGFGLIHGFGFASALRDLALPRAELAWALVGFNLGVEAGQAMILVAVFPVLAWLRRRPWERDAVRVTSTTVGLVGALVFFQRVLFPS